MRGYIPSAFTKIEMFQLWRNYTRVLDHQLTDSHPMMKELLVIGLIHSGASGEDHLYPHMLEYCKLNLTNDNDRPHGIHGTVLYNVFHNTDYLLNKILIWTLGDRHIYGIHVVCTKLDERLYGFLQSTLPKVFVDQINNNSDIRRSGVNLNTHVNKIYGKLDFLD